MKHRLPLLDIRKWHSEPLAFANELRHACHCVGFFMLQHDLPEGLAEETLKETKKFFSLPLEQKMEISYDKSSAFRGYMPMGVENTSGKPDYREQVEIASDTAAAEIQADAWPDYFDRLRGPNQWPKTQPNLQQCIMDYTKHLCHISNHLTEALGLALGLETSAFKHLFRNDPFWQLKLASVSIPPNEDENHNNENKNETKFGVGAHTDTGFFTLLLQDEVGGLQVFVDGEWIDVPPAGPGVLVCNLGEVAQLASGGYVLATPHRVVVPTESRISVPFFYNPTLSAVVDEPLPVSAQWERNPGANDHWRRPGNVILQHYGKNAFKSLARSHPGVFAKHHGDLRLLEDGTLVKDSSSSKSK